MRRRRSKWKSGGIIIIITTIIVTIIVTIITIIITIIIDLAESWEWKKQPAAPRIADWPLPPSIQIDSFSSAYCKQNTTQGCIKLGMELKCISGKSEKVLSSLTDLNEACLSLKVAQIPTWSPHKCCNKFLEKYKITCFYFYDAEVP